MKWTRLSGGGWPDRGGGTRCSRCWLIPRQVTQASSLWIGLIFEFLARSRWSRWWLAGVWSKHDAVGGPGQLGPEEREAEMGALLNLGRHRRHGHWGGAVPDPRESAAYPENRATVARLRRPDRRGLLRRQSGERRAWSGWGSSPPRPQPRRRPGPGLRCRGRVLLYLRPGPAAPAAGRHIGATVLPVWIVVITRSGW